MKEIKHGDIVNVNVSGDTYTARVEERSVYPFPFSRKFLIVEGLMPHFPFEVDDFIKNYGTIIE